MLSEEEIDYSILARIGSLIAWQEAQSAMVMQILLAVGWALRETP